MHINEGGVVLPFKGGVPMSEEKENIQDKIGKKTYDALYKLVEASKLSQDLMDEKGVSSTLSDKAFHKEFCTVKMATSRRAGQDRKSVV